MTATNPFTNPFNKAANAQAQPQFPGATEPVAEAVTPVNMTAPQLVAAPQAMPMPGAGGLGGLPVPGMPQAAPGAQPGAPLPGGFSPYGNQAASGGPALSDDFVIDLSDVSSGSVDFIGAGRHLMYCSAVNNDVSQAGNPMIVFDFTVASGEYTGKTRKVYCALTEKAMWKLDETLRALGIVSNDSRKPTYGQIRSGANRRVIIGEFVASTYNNRPTTDFARVNPPDEIGVKTGTTLDQLLSGQA